MDQPQSYLLDLQGREENETKTKIHRGSVMGTSVRKHGKADGPQRLILMFESYVDFRGEQEDCSFCTRTSQNPLNTEE